MNMICIFITKQINPLVLRSVHFRPFFQLFSLQIEWKTFFYPLQWNTLQSAQTIWVLSNTYGVSCHKVDEIHWIVDIDERKSFFRFFMMFLLLVGVLWIIQRIKLFLNAENKQTKFIGHLWCVSFAIEETIHIQRSVPKSVVCEHSFRQSML